jgi:hypothetical protein
MGRLSKKQAERILNLFTVNDVLRPQLEKPFTAGDYICASDGHAIVAIPHLNIKGEDPSTLNIKESEVSQMALNYLENNNTDISGVKLEVRQIHEFVQRHLVDETKFEDEKVYCSECGQSHYKSIEKKTGRKIGDEKKKAKILGSPISARQLWRLSEVSKILDNNKVLLLSTDQVRNLFQVGEIKIMIMGLAIKGAARDEIIELYPEQFAY